MTENKSPEVSGRAFLGLLKYIKGWGDQEKLDGIIEGAGASAKPIFAERIRVTGWYPYDGYKDFLIAIDRKLGKGDYRYCRELGVVAGQRDMGTIFKIYTLMANADRLIGACNKFWQSYYRNAGTMEAIQSSAEQTVLRIKGFPTMHPTHCKLMEGWISATMDSVGFRILEIKETQCTSRGGDFHDYTFRWQKKK